MDRSSSNRIAIVSLLLSVLIGALTGCGKSDQQTSEPLAFNSPPTLLREIALTRNGDTLAPTRIQRAGDNLLVSYVETSLIDIYSSEWTRLDSILLTEPDPLKPVSFDLDDSLLVVVDHGRAMVAILNREGTLISTFGMLPGGERHLLPYSVTIHNGVAYVTDLKSNGVLAISLYDRGGASEVGELILTIPTDTTRTIDVPSAALVTPDGRLIVGSSANGTIDAYTCDGQFIYGFEKVTAEKTITPQAFDYDDVPDPGMIDSNSFDPSGIRRHGRLHCLDSENARILLYNTLGEFVLSYPDSAFPGRPSGLAINRVSNEIYVADPYNRRVYVFHYEE